MQRRLEASNGRPADLHDDVTYEGWGKSSAAGYREYILYGTYVTSSCKSANDVRQAAIVAHSKR